MAPDISKRLRSARLADLVRGIGEAEAEADLSWWTADDLRAMCRIFEPERYLFEDYVERTRDVLTSLVEHKAALADVLDDIPGAIGFMAHSIEGRYDASGWSFLASSAEVATKVDLEEHRGRIREVSEELASRVDRYLDLLWAIEGQRHVACEVIRRVGDRFVAVAEEIVKSLRFEGADFVLHAYAAFPGRPEVIDLYQRLQSDFEPGSEVHEVLQEYLDKVRTAPAQP